MKHLKMSNWNFSNTSVFKFLKLKCDLIPIKRKIKTSNEK